MLLPDLVPVQLEQALATINSAADLAPNHGEILITRGKILAKLQRWDDAVVDLEAGLRVLPKRGDIHEALAAAYEELGNQGTAEQHRRRAEKLENSTRVPVKQP